MACSIAKETVEQTIAFHGHSCPGLAIGIRVSELAMEKLGIHRSKSGLCVTETDMCAVDAIQFLTQCSFGKGNLIHRDWGKSAFTFYDRNAQKGFRALFTEGATHSDKASEQTRALMAKSLEGKASKEEEELVRERREQRILQIMGADLTTLFSWEDIDGPPVRPARIMKSIPCDACGEMTMETRIRLFGGQRLCIPCFMGVEQKV